MSFKYPLLWNYISFGLGLHKIFRVTSYLMGRKVIQQAYFWMLTLPSTILAVWELGKKRKKKGIRNMVWTSGDLQGRERKLWHAKCFLWILSCEVLILNATRSWAVGSTEGWLSWKGWDLTFALQSGERIWLCREEKGLPGIRRHYGWLGSMKDWLDTWNAQSPQIEPCLFLKGPLGTGE